MENQNTNNQGQIGTTPPPPPPNQNQSSLPKVSVQASSVPLKENAQGPNFSSSFTVPTKQGVSLPAQDDSPASQKTSLAQQQDSSSEGGHKHFSLSKSAATDEDGQIDARTQRGQIVQFVQNVDTTALVDQIFQDAVASRTSDIHIEPFETFLAVRFRIDGEFYEYRNFDIQYAKLILTRIQVLAGLKIDQTRIPQDGKINAGIIEGKRIDMRVSTLPTIYGNKIVIRILVKENKIKTLPQLGYNHDSIKIIKRNLERTYGMMLMSGPTGSGKSTTLFAMLSKYDPFKYNISTLEDPVEYFIEGANQSQINPDAGFDFPDGLRSLVRQDPDIIMLGEIRDNITTKLSVQAAITGHLVFSTVHANTAASTIQRLMNMGADPFLVASALNLVISQRLVRRNCSHCSRPYTPPKKQTDSIKEILENLEPGSQPNFMKGDGCDQCHGSGYLGRIGIYELLEITPTIEKAITEHNGIAQEIEKVAKKEGMVTIKENGVLEALRGNTSLEEILIAVDDQGINSVEQN